ncbi:MAG: molybdopterin-dependent oxidoreductase, partial [Candidatus Poseidoniaceae archaeon]
MTDDSPPSAFTPIERRRVKISDTKKVAAGIPATMSTLKHSIKKMGIIRTAKSLTMINQKHGFDCPGCAWPDPSHATSFEFCENGAKAVADEAMKRTIGRDFFSKFSVEELSMKSDYWLNNQGRLYEPLYKKPRDTHYRPISWDDAFSIITNQMNSLENPNKAVFYTSGRTSNEAAFLYQLMVRQFGTNNLPDCSNMCHESSGRALSQTIGIGKGTVFLEDFDKSDLILVIGQNPGTNHPRMLTALRDAKRNGAKIIHVNPLPETGLVRFKHPQDYLKFRFSSESLADLHLQVKIGSDSALMIGLMKILLEKNAIDQAFIDDYTEGFSNLSDHIHSISWAKILKDTGLEMEEIQKAGEY